MGIKLYLDIETYRPSNKNAFTNEKVIAIGILKEENQAEELEILKEWETKNGEKEIIEKFLNYLNNLTKTHRIIDIIGFNILRFDIPLLTQKAAQYNIAPLPQLNQLWHNTYTTDLFQIGLLLNNMKFKDNNTENLAQKLGIKTPTHGKGKDIAKWYEEKRYKEIEKHLENDITAIRNIYKKLWIKAPKLIKCIYE